MRRIFIFILCLLSLVVQAQKFENLALTPPMGWNSWNKFGCNVDEKLVREMADAMVESGLNEAGYEYIIIDDCWQVGRDENGRIMADPERFPSGMKALADYIHSHGLKFGIYSDAGTATCGGRPGSRGYEYLDAMSYAAWGVDYLKLDWCNSGKQNSEASYSTMRDALYAAGRPVVFSLCEWGSTKPWLWAKDVGHLWRTTADIIDSWGARISYGDTDGLYGWTLIMDLQADLRKYAGPGHWNDPDMLEVGNGGMTYKENRAHFSMWCMMAAPLIAGNDLRDMSEETMQILTNKEVIAIDQDSLGIQAFRALDYGDLEVWAKPLVNDNWAVCFLNRSEESVSLDHNWKKFGFSDYVFNKYLNTEESYSIKNLWTGEDMGTTKTQLKAELPGHDVLLLKLTKK